MGDRFGGLGQIGHILERRPVSHVDNFAALGETYPADKGCATNREHCAYAAQPKKNSLVVHGFL